MERCINQTLFGRDFPSSLLTAMPQLTKKTCFSHSNTRAKIIDTKFSSNENLYNYSMM